MQSTVLRRTGPPFRGSAIPGVRVRVNPSGPPEWRTGIVLRIDSGTSKFAEDNNNDEHRILRHGVKIHGDINTKCDQVCIPHVGRYSTVQKITRVAS